MKKIINFTPTGTQPNRENSYAPLTPSEIIEEVHEAYEMGITLTHIHARHPETLTNSTKKEHYQPIIEGIRSHCSGLTICVSLTGRLVKDIVERSEVLELYPDMGSLTMSSIKGVNQKDYIFWNSVYEYYGKKYAIWNQPISYYNKLNPTKK